MLVLCHSILVLRMVQFHHLCFIRLVIGSHSVAACNRGMWFIVFSSLFSLCVRVCIDATIVASRVPCLLWENSDYFVWAQKLSTHFVSFCSVQFCIASAVWFSLFVCIACLWSLLWRLSLWPHLTGRCCFWQQLFLMKPRVNIIHVVGAV